MMEGGEFEVVREAVLMMLMHEFGESTWQNIREQPKTSPPLFGRCIFEGGCTSSRCHQQLQLTFCKS